MMGKRSSKVLEEIVTEMPDGRTVFYGRMGNVVRITVKCAFTLEKEMGINEAVEAAMNADAEMHKSMVAALDQMGHKRNIVETGMTARGLKAGRPSKMRYTIYIASADEGNDEEKIFFIVGEMKEIAAKALENNGLAISEEGVKGRWLKKK